MLFTGDWMFNEDYEKLAGYKSIKEGDKGANNPEIIQVNGNQTRLDAKLEAFAKQYRTFYRTMA